MRRKHQPDLAPEARGLEYASSRKLNIAGLSGILEEALV
jgi:hypothetical protein